MSVWSNLVKGKATLTEKCIHCGTCIDNCPDGVIVRKEESEEVAMDINKYKDTWVYIEVFEGKIKNVGLELLGEGRKIADALGQKLAGVLIGDNVADLAKEIIAAGADQVYLVEAPELALYNTDSYTATFVDLIETHKPAVILIGATNDGKDLCGRVACRVSTGVTTDCIGLGIDDATGLVAWTRQAFGGNYMATVLCPEHRPQMGIVRSAVFKRPQPDYGRTGEIIRVTSKVKAEDIRTKLIKFVRASTAACKLEEAEIIVSGGRGVGNPENFRYVEDLANVLGGAVGASRAVVDAGWKSHTQQVGQTGKTVGAKIYFACGISGAIQHIAGITSSDIIIDINKDPDAPIFKTADYGIVGDLTEVLPILTEEFRKIKES